MFNYKRQNYWARIASGYEAIEAKEASDIGAGERWKTSKPSISQRFEAFNHSKMLIAILWGAQSLAASIHAPFLASQKFLAASLFSDALTI